MTGATDEPDAVSTPDAVGAAVSLAVGPESFSTAGRLLHDFNTEYDDPSPGAE